MGLHKGIHNRVMEENIWSSYYPIKANIIGTAHCTTKGIKGYGEIYGHVGLLSPQISHKCTQQPIYIGEEGVPIVCALLFVLFSYLPGHHYICLAFPLKFCAPWKVPIVFVWSSSGWEVDGGQQGDNKGSKQTDGAHLKIFKIFVIFCFWYLRCFWVIFVMVLLVIFLMFLLVIFFSWCFLCFR